MTPVQRAFLTRMLADAEDFLAPIADAQADPRALYREMSHMGWNLEGLLTADLSGLPAALQTVNTAINDLKDAAKTGDDAAIAAAIAQGLAASFASLDTLHTLLMTKGAAGAAAPVVAAFATDLRDYLILRWLARHAPMAVQLGRLLSVVQFSRKSKLKGVGGVLLRFPVHRFSLHLDDLWTAPANALAAVLQQASAITPSTPKGFAQTLTDILSEPLQGLVQTNTRIGFDEASITLTPTGVAFAAPWLPAPSDVAAAGPVSLQWATGLPVPVTLTIDATGWHVGWAPPGAPQAGGTLLSTDLFILSLPTGAEAAVCPDPALRIEVVNNTPQLTIAGGLAISTAPNLLETASGQISGAVCGRITLPLNAPAQITLETASLSASGAVALGAATSLSLSNAAVTISGITITADTGMTSSPALAAQGTLDVAGSQITVAASYDTATGGFAVTSTGEVHLGGGVWLQPIDAAPVLNLTSDASDTATFAVSARCLIPQDGAPDGTRAIDVSGALTLSRVAGTWAIETLSASGAITGANCTLPGGVTLDNAALSVDLDAGTESVTATVSGGLQWGAAARSTISVTLIFDDITDPRAIRIDSTLDLVNIALSDTATLISLQAKLAVTTQVSCSSVTASGSLTLSQGSLGLFPDTTHDPLHPDPAQFGLAVSGLIATCTFGADGLAMQVTAGILRLPNTFTTSSSGSGPTVAINAAAPLRLTVGPAGVAFDGAFDIANIGAALGETGLAATLDSATLRFANLAPPQLTNAAGTITMPLPDATSLQIVFSDVAWGLNGLPTGEVRLGHDLEIPLGEGFIFKLAGGNTGSALQVTRSSWTLNAAMQLAIPASMITDVDGDEITLSTAGSLSLPTTGATPTFAITELRAGGSFHLGGADGILVSDGEIAAQNIANMLSPSEANPFIVAVSGEIALPDGPRGGLQNARFIFAGAPLPTFDLDGIIVGSGDMALAGGYLPVDIQRLVVQFKPGLSLPEKIYPENLTLTADATISIGDVLHGGVEDLTISFDDQGVPAVSLDAFQLEVSGLEMGTFTLGGGLYIGGLQDIPDGLVMAGKLEGKMNGTGITALAAFGVVDGVFVPLGAALAVDLGAVGIPLGPSGFLLTGVAGGVSFTGSAADPDDLRAYVDVSDDGTVTSTPLPDPSSESGVPPVHQAETAPAAAPPANEPLAFICPSEPCPTPNIGVFYEPHPDSDAYPDRVIVRFSALNKRQVDGMLELAGLSPTTLQAQSPQSIATAITREVMFNFRDIPGPLQQTVDEIALSLDNTLRFGLEKALGDADNLYDALLHLAYKGLRAPNVNTKLTGTFSYAGVSAFLSVTGGFVFSPTSESVGIVGSINLVGIPVGKLRGFFVGVSDPFICGDVTLALGPLDLGHLRLNYSAGFDMVAFAAAFIPLAGSVATPALRAALRRTAPEALAASGNDPIGVLSRVPPEQLIALLGALMQSDTSPDIRALLSDLFTLVWDQFNPQLLICGSAQPKIFGLALGEEVVGISANADKLSVAASFRVSPTAILSYCLYNILPAFDKMEFGFRLSLPDPSDLIAAGFAGKAGLGDLGNFAKDGIDHLLADGVTTIRYSIAPFGITLADAQGRMIMPDLLNHPAGRTHTRPEDQGARIPSRREVAIAALDDNVLGNPHWTGDSGQMQALSTLKNARNVGSRDLRRDYFPHGGIIGAGKLALPKILINAPPYEQISQLVAGSLPEKLRAAQFILAQCTQTDVVGRLSFYAPLPNPPLAELAAGASPQDLINRMQSNGVFTDQLSDPNIYPGAEAFMEGFLGKPDAMVTLLGIPLGNASITLQPPDGDAAGIFIIEGKVPAGSWLSQWVQSATLRFHVSQPPSQSIAERFSDLSADFDGGSAPLRALTDALTDDLPKIALEVDINKLSLPPVFRDLFGVSASASATLNAYSPHYAYVAGQTPVTALARVRHHGGVLLQIRDLSIVGRFGLKITDVDAAFAMTNDGLGFPDMAAKIDVDAIDLPFGLGKLRDGQVLFESAAIGLKPVVTKFHISGRLGTQTLDLALNDGPKKQLVGAMAGSWGLKFTLPSIRQPGTNLVLGDPVAVSLRIQGSTRLTLTEGAAPKAQLRNLSLTWQGKTLALQPLPLTAAVNSPATLLKALQREAAAAIRTEIMSAHKTAAAWVRSILDGTLKIANLTAETAAKILRGFGLSIKQAITHLKSLFPAVKDVIQGLYEAFNKNISDVLDALATARFNTASAIVQAVRSLFGASHLDALTSYLWARFGTRWRSPLRTLSGLFKSAGFNALQIIRSIRASLPSIGLQQIMEAIYNTFGRNMADTFTALRDAGFSSSTPFAAAAFGLFGGGAAFSLAKLFKDRWTTWSNPITSIARRFEAAGFTITDTTRALRDVFGANQLTAIANGLISAWGNALVNITKALKSVFGSSATKLEQIAKALKAKLGSSTNDITHITAALISAWGSSSALVVRITKALRATFGTSRMNRIAQALKARLGSSTAQIKKIANAMQAAWGNSKIDDITIALKSAWNGDSALLRKLIAALLDAFDDIVKITAALVNAGFSAAAVGLGLSNAT